MMRLAVLPAAALLTVIIHAPSAEAAFIADIEQVGPNVVITGSGSLDISGASAVSDESSGAGGSLLYPYYDALVIGQSSADIGNTLSLYQFHGVSGSGPFGPNVVDTTGTAAGDIVQITHQNSYTGIGLDPTYTSGSPLANVTIFQNATFDSLAIVPGVYTFNLPNDTFTIDIGTDVSPVPLPSALPMFGSALLTLAGLGLIKLKKSVDGQPSTA